MMTGHSRSTDSNMGKIFDEYPELIALEMEEDMQRMSVVLQKLPAVRLVQQYIDYLKGIIFVVEFVDPEKAKDFFTNLSLGCPLQICQSGTEECEGCKVIILGVKPANAEVTMFVPGKPKEQSYRLKRNVDYFLRPRIDDKLWKYYMGDVQQNELAKKLGTRSQGAKAKAKPKAKPQKSADIKKFEKEVVSLSKLFDNVNLNSGSDPHVPELSKSNLNKGQQLAVKAALNPKKNIVCIQGPPGTGKTKTLSEVIAISFQRLQKVLVYAPSHVAVKNIKDVSKARLSQLRIKLGPLDTCDREDLEKAIENHAKFSAIVAMRIHQRTLRASSVQYEKEEKRIRNKYREIQNQLLRGVRVFYSTVGSGFIQSIIQSAVFVPELIIIDEASQLTEASVWPVLHQARGCVLAGDPQQLPAVVKSRIALSRKFNVSLMERLMTTGKCKSFVMLTEQYRSNEAIMMWSSKVFYQNRLVSDKSVASQTLKSLIGNEYKDYAHFGPLVLFDTDLSLMLKFEEISKLSIYNESEAILVIAHAFKLITTGVDVSKIAVITPYVQQKTEIKLLMDRFELGVGVFTVDEFQGQEREVIIFSFVRNNPDGIGFLKDTRRGNVAVTRAKLQIAIIASATMLKMHPHYDELLRVVIRNGAVVNPDIYLRALGTSV